MLIAAARELDIDLAQSIMIGDNVTDVEAGARAGCCRSVYLHTRERRSNLEGYESMADAIRDLLAES